jgi:hypothetical protein
MEESIYSPQSSAQEVLITDITAYGFDLGPIDRERAAMDKRPHLEASLEESLDEMAADETRSSGDKCAHRSFRHQPE